MLTRLLRYLLRSISTLVLVALGGLVAGPAFAENQARHKAAREDADPSPAVQTGENDVVHADAEERANVNNQLVNDVQDLYLAKRSIEAHRVGMTQTAQVPVAAQTPPVRTRPAVAPLPKPVKDVPTTKPVSRPIKTVKDAVKTVMSPIVNVSKVAGVLAYARAQLGERYMLGGAGPTVWDCSGLTMKAFASVGIDIGGHGVNVQYNLAARRGYLVPWSQRKPGDLVFYGTPGNFSHVAISAGGNTIIEAPNPDRPVIERHYWGQPYGQVARFIR